MRTSPIRWIAGAAIVALLAGASSSAAQETAEQFPSKPITFVVPFTAGGSSDLMARTLAPLLEEQLGGTVNVENRPGATATLATSEVAAATPDGYTIMINPVGIFTLQPLLRPVQYEIGEFRGLSGLSIQEIVIAVNSAAPWDDFAALVADLTSRDGEIVYGSSGNVGFPHIAEAAVLDAAGVTGRHVAFEGSAQAVTALLGGHVEMIAVHPPEILPHIAAGTVRALGVMSSERLEMLPEIPTFVEQGYDVGEFAVWNSALTQAAVPDDIAAELEAAFQWALTQPAWTETATRLNFTTFPITGMEVSQRLEAESDLHGGLVDSLGLRQK